MSWQRPKTTRRYLHPPKTERMFTLWREGKLVMGEVDRNSSDSHQHYHEHISTVLLFVRSKYAQMFDFRNSECTVCDDGTPIHGLSLWSGGYDVNFEAFCDTKRKTTCFARISFTNTAPYTVTERFGFIVRRGSEKALVFGSPDGYMSYNPEVSTLKYAKSTFEFNGKTLRDGDSFIDFDTDMPLCFDDGTLWVDVTAESGKTVLLTFSMGMGDTFEYDYDAQRQITADFWKKELGRLTYQGGYLDYVKPLTVQMLQCFNFIKDTDTLLFRQGGLQRLVWPWDAEPALMSLARIGDFEDYLKKMFESYFDAMQEPDGKIRVIGEDWAGNTGHFLNTLCDYCLTRNDGEFFVRCADNAYRMFSFIKNLRKESDNGLFPALRGCDWGEEFQYWIKTDVDNVIALGKYLEALRYFGGDCTDEVASVLESYTAAVQAVWHKFEDAAKDSDTLRLPLTVDGNDGFLINGFYPYLIHGAFVNSGFVKDGDIPKILKSMEEMGLCKNGLYGHMPYKNGDSHIWYTTWPELGWYFTFRRLGQDDKAQEIIDAEINYSMTDEYYMVERFSDRDPWFVPWSPNASAAGRLILMFLN